MIRRIAYRMDVLRNGARAAELKWRAEDPPMIYASAAAQIKMGLRGEFFLDADFDPLRDELQPVIIEDGAETPLGVFLPISVAGVRDGALRTISVEAYDRGKRVQDTRTERTLHLSAGTLYTSAVASLLTGAGITAAIIAPSALTLATDREDWPLGTDYLTIINTLLQEINYAPLWFDAFGWAHAQPEIAADGSIVTHTYLAGDTRLIHAIAPDGGDQTDLWDRPNVFLLVCSNPDLDAPLVARSENNNPVSASSILRRGRRIVERMQVDNVANLAELQSMADRVCKDSMMASQTITFETPAQGGHGIGDVVGIHHPDFTGIYRETGWTLELSPGAMMKHSAERMTPNG